ncbi:MAG: ClpXP protease specificity-enhancing factor [Betaproteobacteria bacterium]|nr:ClpXP protease specificity-enhancing factor [Betaproteobacteria bacterium]
MVSTKPYLIRAIYEWCVDQGFTPYLAVQVDQLTQVPSGYVREGQIVLNVGPEATHQLKIDNELVTFQARFNGVAHQIVAPIGNVLAIYARENGQGIAFEATGAQEDMPVGKASGSAEESAEPPDEHPPPSSPPRGSHLKVIK